MFKLLSFPPAFGEPSPSAFCVKAMCLLELSGVVWQPDFEADSRKAPKTKLPVLQDGERLIADSEAIRAHIETSAGIDFDEGLSRAERGTSRALIRMVDEHLYFLILADRWLNDRNFVHIRNDVLHIIPFPVSLLVIPMIRKQVRAQVQKQGVGRHSAEERLERARLDIEAISAVLADKQFLFGDKPTAADACVVPMLAAISGFPEKTAMAALVDATTNLGPYVQRGKETFYPKNLSI